MSFPDQDSDDGAPEDVSFSIGRADALRDMELIVSERKKGNPAKEWRQKRDAQYKKQKEQKQLSLDILTKADEDLKKKHAIASKLVDAEVVDKDDDDDAEISDYDDSEQEEDENSDKESGIGVDDSDDNDHAQVEGENRQQEVIVSVVRKRGPQPLLQSALDFKRQALYGRGVRRTNMAQVRSRDTKRKAMDQLKRDLKKRKGH